MFYNRYNYTIIQLIKIDKLYRFVHMWLSAVEILVDELEKIFDHDKNITEEEDRETYLCINNSYRRTCKKCKRG